MKTEVVHFIKNVSQTCQKYVNTNVHDALGVARFVDIFLMNKMYVSVVFRPNKKRAENAKRRERTVVNSRTLQSSCRLLL